MSKFSKIKHAISATVHLVLARILKGPRYPLMAFYVYWVTQGVAFYVYSLFEFRGDFGRKLPPSDLDLMALGVFARIDLTALGVFARILVSWIRFPS